MTKCRLTLLLLNLALWHNVVNSFPTCINDVLTLKYSRTKQTKRHDRGSGSSANDLNLFLLDLSHLVRALLKAKLPFIKKWRLPSAIVLARVLTRVPVRVLTRYLGILIRSMRFLRVAASYTHF